MVFFKMFPNIIFHRETLLDKQLFFFLIAVGHMIKDNSFTICLVNKLFDFHGHGKC